MFGLGWFRANHSFLPFSPESCWPSPCCGKARKLNPGELYGFQEEKLRNPKLLGFKGKESKRHGLQGRAPGAGWHLEPRPRGVPSCDRWDCGEQKGFCCHLPLQAPR